MDTIFTCSGMSWMIGLSVESYCSLNLFSPISFAIIEDIVALLTIRTSIQTNVLRLMVDINWVASKYHRNIYCASTGWTINDAVFRCILGRGSGSRNTENTGKYRSSIVLNTENVQYRNFNTIEYRKKSNIEVQ